jgi:hypothetical protein
MTNQTSMYLRLLTILLIGALVVSGCGGTLSLDLNGNGGDESGGTAITQNQLLTVLMIVLLVVALVGILR